MIRFGARAAVGVILSAATAVCVSAATTPATAPAGAPATTSPPAGPKPAPTPDDIQNLVDQGQYSQAIAGINRLLDPKHPPDFDRTAMLMLRAECTLQLKQATATLDLLDGIRKQAHKDAAKLDEARAAAFMFLIHKSPGLLYTPKTGSDKIPVTILDRKSRDHTYRALYDDELSVSQQMAKEAAFGTSLAPIVKVTDELYSVQAVELVVTNGIANSKAVAQQLLKSTRTIVVPAEIAFDKDIVAISVDSHRLVTGGRGMSVRNGVAQENYGTTVTGLSSRENERLNDIKKECQGVLDLINRLRILADDPNALSGPYGRAEALIENCSTVLAGGTVTYLGDVPDDDSTSNTTPPRRRQPRGGGGG